MRHYFAVHADCNEVCIYLPDVGGQARIYGDICPGGHDPVDDKGEEIVGRLLIIAILLLSAFSFQLSAHAAEVVSSRELIENSVELDGKTVLYRGELISGVLNRGDYSWANLHDGYAAIGVWCRTSQLADVKFAGDYKNTGDTIEVEGVFNRACALHRGELDIHAFRASVVERGFVREKKTDKKRARLSVIAFAILLVIIMVFRNRL